MKNLNLSELDLSPLQDCEEDIRVEVQGAIVEYYFHGTIHKFNNEIAAALFKGMFRTFQIRSSRSECGAKRKGVSKAKSKQNESKTEAKPKQNQSKLKANVAETQLVTSTFAENSKKIGVKETENKEEDTPSPSNLPQTLSFTSTPIEEEKKDKEKKEMQKKVDIDEEKEISFYEQMKEHYPRVMSMRQPLTWKQYLKMTTEDGFSARLIKSILEEMENYVLLTTKYVSASMTIRSWIKRRGR